MALQVIQISSNETKAALESIITLTNGGTACLQSYDNYFNGINGGIYRATMQFAVGAVQATATMTSTGSATNGETFSLANVTFTAETSGATGNQFNISSNVTTQAANIAAAINGSSNLAGICTATSALGVVTITAVYAGPAGNGLQFSESMTNVTSTAFANGALGDTLTVTKAG